jgi:phage portal protein BeeE
VPSIIQRARFGLRAFRESAKFAAQPNQSSRIVNGARPGLRVSPPKRDTAALCDAFNDSPYFHAVVSVLATAVAETQWHIYAPIDHSGQMAYEPSMVRNLAAMPFQYRMRELKQQINKGRLRDVIDHPVKTLLAGGTTDFVGFTLLKLTQEYLEIDGEAFWALERNQFGVPINAIPVPPAWISSKPSPDHPFYEVRFSLVRETIPKEDMLLFHDPDPSNPFQRGTGIGQPLTREIDVDAYASEVERTTFANGARPDIAISMLDAGEDEIAIVERGWLEKFQGIWNRAKPVFTNREMKIQELGTRYEKELPEMRKYQRDIMLQVAGLPPEIIGNIENRSTVTAALDMFQRLKVRPRLELNRQIMQRGLLPDGGFLLDFDDPVDDDNQFQLNSMQVAPWVPTLNEWRKMQNLPPDTGPAGDMHMVPDKYSLVDFDKPQTLAPDRTKPNDAPPDGSPDEPVKPIYPDDPEPKDGK